MHEPVVVGRIAAPAVAGGRFRALTSDAVLAGIDEAANDLSELGFLISDLSELAGSAESPDSIDPYALSEKWLQNNFKQGLQLLKSRYERHLDLIERASRWGTAAQLSPLLATARREYIAIKSSLRVAYRQRGMMLCANDWQSPVYAASIPVGTNRLSDGIAEHVLDYKRDGHLEAIAYEKAFVEEYVSHLGSKQIYAYAANSGMAAFSTILHWLAHEVRTGEPAMALQPMYFENIHLARGFFPNILQLDVRSSEELLFNLRKQQPAVILCDAVSNCGEVITHDIETILSWAAHESEQQTFVVIDSTCVPAPLLPSGMLKDLPAHVSVILVESLAKHHQFGMDVVTGGILVAHMAEQLHADFRKARARFGMNISDTSIGSLPKPNRDKLTRRMQRHSRNAKLISEALEAMGDDQSGAVESVSWLAEGPAYAPWYHGSCMTVRLRKGFRSIDNYRDYERKVLELAKEANHPIAFSTSFGFDVSRLYVTAPSTRFEEPFLRLSVGTETTAEIDVLIGILGKASVALARGKQVLPKEKRSVITEAKAKTVPPAPVIVEKPGLHSSVYLGEQGLKDYLSPANYPAAPLIELPGDLNPYRKDGVRLFAKMMPLVPLMNIKSIPAFSMLSKAAERGELDGIKNVIESSSSNTVLSLSVMAKLFGIETTTAIVDHSIAPSLVRMLRLFGIEIMLHPAAGHELFGKMQPRSERASAYNDVEGWLNPGQYSNPDNPEGFAKWLAPDLWAQTEGRLSVLACGLGTCGTMVGVTRGLREQNPDLQVVACCPAAGHAVPGPREASLLGDVTFQWQDVANSRIELGAEESFSASIKLLRRGILGGPSSGMNYAGALQYFEAEKASGRLAAQVADTGEVWCAFLCCDSPLPHVDEYFDALGDQYFPTIHPVPPLDESTINFAP